MNEVAARQLVANVSTNSKPEPAMTPEPGTALWRIDQAAEYLGIRPKTLYEWVRTGRVPHRKLGFNVRFEPAELESWVREQSAAAVATASPPGDQAVSELCEVATEAARRLRRLESEAGAQLSFPQRQAIKELAHRLERAARAAGGA